MVLVVVVHSSSHRDCCLLFLSSSSSFPLCLLFFAVFFAVLISFLPSWTKVFERQKKTTKSMASFEPRQILIFYRLGSRQVDLQELLL